MTTYSIREANWNLSLHFLYIRVESEKPSLPICETRLRKRDLSATEENTARVRRNWRKGTLRVAGEEAPKVVNKTKGIQKLDVYA